MPDGPRPRCLLEQLPVLGQVAARRVDVAVGLDGVDADRLVARRHPAVDGRARDDHVVALVHVDVPELGLHGGRPGLDVAALVADGVLVERAGLGRRDIADPDVAVAKEQASVADGVEALALGLGGQVVGLEVARQQGVVGRERLVRQLPGTHVDDRAGDVAVVEQARVRAEALLTHELLVVEVALGGAVLRVALGRDAARAAVVSHDVSSLAQLIHQCTIWTVADGSDRHQGAR